MDISGDLSGYLEDGFWTRRHSELQQRVLHIESLKQSLLQQLQQRQQTLQSIQVEQQQQQLQQQQQQQSHSWRQEDGQRMDATLLPIPDAANTMLTSPLITQHSSSTTFPPQRVFVGGVGFDLSAIAEGDSFQSDSKLDSQLDSFHGLPTSAKVVRSATETDKFLPRDLSLAETFDHYWKTLTSETLTSLETGKLSRCLFSESFSSKPAHSKPQSYHA